MDEFYTSWKIQTVKTIMIVFDRYYDSNLQTHG